MNAYSQEMKVIYKEFEDSNSVLRYKITANYPHADFGPDALMGVRGIAEDINNVLDTTVAGIIKKFKSSAEELPAVDSELTESTLDISGRGWVSNGSLLSAELNVFSYLAGMAHPITTVTGYNFDINGNGPISISDLFTKNSGYLNYLSTTAVNRLTAHAESEGYSEIKQMILEGTSPETKNFDNWVVENDSLIIIFKPYQVGPYVMGIQTVSIPLSELTGMIDPKGPLSFMIR